MTIHLHLEMSQLKEKILEQASLVEKNLELAIQAIEDNDINFAQQVIKSDHIIDMQEVYIEEECLKLLALYQPVAGDLRMVITVLKLNNDLERVGDLAVNIAKRAIYLINDSGIFPAIEFSTMALKARKMLKWSIDALVRMDVEMAKTVCKEDDEVDEMNRDMYRKIKDLIRVEPERLDTWINLLTISHSLERIADHATNLAEDIVYLVEGSIIRHSSDINKA